jgi:glycosyltransferase involved in cell wall biosynthesis
LVAKNLTRSIPDVSVIIPAYNEEGTIGRVIAELLRIKNAIPSMEIIVVDDGSSDRTAIKASQFPSVRLIEHAENMGKGAALKTGFKEAVGRVAVIQDADMEYYPSEIPRVVKPILSGNADAVFGTRFKSRPNGMSFSHFIGNITLSRIVSMLYRKKISDIMTGCKAFSNEVLKSFELKANGFSVEVELTSQILQNQWRFQEVPISYAYRSYGSSKISILDGIICLLQLLVDYIR